MKRIILILAATAVTLTACADNHEQDRNARTNEIINAMKDD